MATRTRRKFAGSPIFTGGSENDSISSGSIVVYDFAKNAAQSEKYAPFNFIKIINNDTSNDLTVKINQDDDKTVSVPAGTIIDYDGESFPAIWGVQVKNEGTGTNSAFRLEVQKEVINTQDVVSGVAGKVFGFSKKDVV